MVSGSKREKRLGGDRSSRRMNERKTVSERTSEEEIPSQSPSGIVDGRQREIAPGARVFILLGVRDYGSFSAYRLVFLFLCVFGMRPRAFMNVQRSMRTCRHRNSPFIFHTCTPSLARGRTKRNERAIVANCVNEYPILGVRARGKR